MVAILSRILLIVSFSPEPTMGIQVNVKIAVIMQINSILYLYSDISIIYINGKKV